MSQFSPYEQLRAHAGFKEFIKTSYKLSPATLGPVISRGWWLPADHLKYLSTIIATRVAAGGGRIIVSAPPRHGKSELISVNTPIWFLEKYPTKNVVTATYGADLATDFAVRVRDTFFAEDNADLLDTRLRKDRKRVDRFLTTDGGSATAIGVGGALTGRGADLLILDDFIKNAEDSLSQTIRDKTWQWFLSTAYTRLEPGATLIILATRWHKDDLIGRCLTELDHEPWDVVHLPAIAGENDLLGRAPGEALWPERYNVEQLEQIKATLGSYWFRAMYQADPMAKMSEADIGGQIRVVDEEKMPNIKFMDTVRAWDLAGTENAGDFTAGPLMAKPKNSGKIFIYDMRHAQKSPRGVEQLVRNCAEGDGVGTSIVMEEEPGSSGKIASAHYGEEVIPEFTFKARHATGPIEVRAQPFLAACEAGNIHMVKAPWNKKLVDEIDAFPDGKHDDQVVALALGYNELMGHKGRGLVWGRGSYREGEGESDSGIVIPIRTDGTLIGEQWAKVPKRRSRLTW